jgi:hypothetical protein
MSAEPSDNGPESLPDETLPEEDFGSDRHGLSRAERRAARRADRRSRRGAGGWILGAILIVVGVGLLLQAFGRIDFTNWWALFIFIPAVGSFAAAGRRYQDAGGRLTSGALGSLIGGVVLSVVALAFLFSGSLELNWNVIWPLLLILGGVAILLQVVIS